MVGTRVNLSGVNVQYVRAVWNSIESESAAGIRCRVVHSSCGRILQCELCGDNRESWSVFDEAFPAPLNG